MIVFVLSGAAQAQTTTLRGALEAALSRATTVELESLQDTSGWLAGLPSLTVAYYDSQERLGTDEAELIFNLPFKSTARRNLDKGLKSIDTGLAEASENHRRWVYSGLVRERAWAHRIALSRYAASAEKRALLETLAVRISRLAERGAVPVYQGLIVKRELLEMELESFRLAGDRDTAQAAFVALTGFTSVPDDLTEPDTPPEIPDYASHPLLLLLDQASEQQQQLLALSAPEISNWNLGLVARNFDGPEFNDRQFGASLELPLGFADVRSAGNLSARRAARRDYLLERDRLSIALRTEWDALRAEAGLLQQRKQLLSEAEQLATRIQAQLERLDATNELEAELLLRRMLDVLDTRAEASLTDALIGRNAARLRQAAGRAL